MGNFLVRFLSRKIPPSNPKTVCPPGKLQPSVVSLPLVVVASFPRSGTHLLIDLILNNFPAYRRAPLYVNLDEYISQGLDVEELIRIGGYVVKTHYPEPTFSADNQAAYERVFANALVISPRRSEVEIVRSYQRMTDLKRRSEVVATHHTYLAFWEERAKLLFEFSDLINPLQTEAVLARLAKRLGMEPEGPTVGPPDRKRYLRVCLRKLGTRIFGNRLTKVNTTVGFAKTKLPSAPSLY
jgi:hypothetical protein